MTDKGFWAKVSSRHIPELADFHLDGYLKRFRLQLTTAPEADGKHLAIAMGEGLYFPATGKILVQVSMAALADEQTYKRPPLNLVVGIRHQWINVDRRCRRRWNDANGWR